MSQIITIECSDCENVFKEEVDHCVIVAWRGKEVGIFRHDVTPGDLLEAIKELALVYRQESVDQAKRN